MAIKKDKRNLYFVVMITLIALGVLGAVAVNAFWYAPEAEVEVSSNFLSETTAQKNNPEKKSAIGNKKENQAVAEGYPIRLRIPTLEINAKVQKVGINTKGNMAAPSNFKDVGWYKYGALPGDMGSSVMAGHVDNGLAFAGVFKRLGELKKGDDVYVDTDDGKRIRFRVIGSQVYDYDANVPEVFAERDGRYLKLITCTGTWIQSNRTHNKRLVVIAEKYQAENS
ncbi:MAG: class F sortase [Candidatus Yanofskybacteria bacterium]|nr:class F sortase [Candidatus Yanofskybacteria bacterium]